MFHQEKLLTVYNPLPFLNLLYLLKQYVVYPRQMDLVTEYLVHLQFAYLKELDFPLHL